MLALGVRNAVKWCFLPLWAVGSYSGKLAFSPLYNSIVSLWGWGQIRSIKDKYIELLSYKNLIKSIACVCTVCHDNSISQQPMLWTRSTLLYCFEQNGVFSPFIVRWLSLQTAWTQIQTNRTSVLIWIQTVWHSREGSGSVVECLTGDRRAAGSSLTGVTASWSLSETH